MSKLYLKILTGMLSIERRSINNYRLFRSAFSCRFAFFHLSSAPLRGQTFADFFGIKCGEGRDLPHLAADDELSFAAGLLVEQVVEVVGSGRSPFCKAIWLL